MEHMKILLIVSILTLISLPVWSGARKISAENQSELLTPEEALQDINQGKLIFMGRQIFPGSGQNYTCVYRSETAYILYNNCMANKKESQATDIEVLSFNGDIASFYILNKDSIAPISSGLRSGYDMSWRVSATESPAISAKLTVEDLKKHKEKHSEVSGGCSIGSTFKAQDMTSKAFCLGGVKSPQWMLAAEMFWLEPTESWYETLKYLRTVVVGTKF
jgi:hypothetical protein